MRFIHISDVRLGCLPDSGFPWAQERAEGLWKTFEDVVRECVRLHVDLLLIAGNLFDHSPNPQELKRANRIFAGAEGLQVVISGGYRDFLREESAYENFSWAKNVCFLNMEEPCSVYLPELDVTVQGFSYNSPVRVDRIIEDMSPFDDGSIQILLACGGQKRRCPFDLNRLQRAGFDYCALGGQLTQQILPPGNIAYPGSLEPFDPEDPGAHGYILGEIRDDGDDFRFVPFSKPRYVRVKVNISADTTFEELKDSLTKAVNSHGTANIYSITLEGKHMPGKPLPVRKLYQIGHIIEVNDRTISGYDMTTLLEEHREDVVGMYVEEFMKKPADDQTRQALYRGLDALLCQEEREEHDDSGH